MQSNVADKRALKLDTVKTRYCENYHNFWKSILKDSAELK